MKAENLIKKPIEVSDIYPIIEQRNNEGANKHFIPHWIYVKDSVKNQLMQDGFKLYIGNWDAYMINALIIEW